MRKLFAATAALALLAGAASNANEPATTDWAAQDKVSIVHPEWSKDAVLCPPSAPMAQI